MYFCEVKVSISAFNKLKLRFNKLKVACNKLELEKFGRATFEVDPNREFLSRVELELYGDHREHSQSRVGQEHTERPTQLAHIRQKATTDEASQSRSRGFGSRLDASYAHDEVFFSLCVASPSRDEDPHHSLAFERNAS